MTVQRFPARSRWWFALLQKGALALLGALMACACLELALRTAGGVFLLRQDMQNRFVPSGEGTYRVLCLGESTTAGQYPPFLEELLNQRGGGVTYRVIDKGVPGTSTSRIVQQLNAYLDQYRPDIVVTMMGINDQLRFNFLPQPGAHGVFKWLTSLQVYKVACYMREGLKRRLAIARTKRSDEIAQSRHTSELSAGAVQSADIRRGDSVSAESGLQELLDASERASSAYRFAEARRYFEAALARDPRSDQTLVGLGRMALRQKQYPNARDFYTMALLLNPRNDCALVGLAAIEVGSADFWAGADDQGQLKEAKKLLRMAMALNPRSDKAIALLGRIAFKGLRFPDARDFYTVARWLNPRNELAVAGMGVLLFDNGYQEESIDYFRTALILEEHHAYVRNRLATTYMFTHNLAAAERVLLEAPEQERDHRMLMRIYEEMHKPRYAQAHASEVVALGLNEYPLETQHNYIWLKRTLDRRRITWICAQYPMRKSEPLKQLLAGEGGVRFVDNERSFRDAVEREGYSAYFTDAFGGDFGHCTEKGNRLLAQNIARVILDETKARDLGNRP